MANIDQIDQYDNQKRLTYTKEAVVYDPRRYLSPTGAFWEECANQRIFSFLNPTAQSRIADIATGTGRAAIGLASRGMRVFGADLTHAMLLKAKEKLERQNIATLSLCEAQARQLPFTDGTFEHAISIRFLHIMPRSFHQPFIAEMVRILKPRGTLIIELNNGIPYWRNALFAKKKMEVIWPWQISKHFQPYRVIETRGVVLPGLGRLSRFSRPCAFFVARLGSVFPFKYLCREILIKLQKEP